jgi:hypothetical protein
MCFFSVISILKTAVSSLVKYQEPIESVGTQPMQSKKVVLRETKALGLTPHNACIKA